MPDQLSPPVNASPACSKGKASPRSLRFSLWIFSVFSVLKGFALVQVRPQHNGETYLTIDEYQKFKEHFAVDFLASFAENGESASFALFSPWQG